jgi:hypothetical protein
MSARRTSRHGNGVPGRQAPTPVTEFGRPVRVPHPRRLLPGSRHPRIRALELPSSAPHPLGGVV